MFLETSRESRGSLPNWSQRLVPLGGSDKLIRSRNHDSPNFMDPHLRTRLNLCPSFRTLKEGRILSSLLDDWGTHCRKASFCFLELFAETRMNCCRNVCFFRLFGRNWHVIVNIYRLSGMFDGGQGCLVVICPVTSLPGFVLEYITALNTEYYQIK